MTFNLHNPGLFSIGLDGSIGRAMFVAALAVALYVCAKYFSSLRGSSIWVRFGLTGLRAFGFVLVACLIGGLGITDNVAKHKKVFIRDDAPASENVSAQVDAISRQISSALNSRGIESVVKHTDESLILSDDEKGFSDAIMVTDAALSDNRASEEVEKASVSSGGSPVSAMVAFDNQSPRVSIKNVSFAGNAQLGVVLDLNCLVHAANMKGRESIVTVSDDAKIQNSATLNWNGDDEDKEFTLEVTPKVTGFIDYTLKVEGINGETPGLNSRVISVHVSDQRYKILFIEGQPTWDGKFIRRALESSNTFDVDYFAQVSKAATAGSEAASDSGGKVKASPDEDPIAKLHAILASSIGLNEYSCLVVGSTPNDTLSAAEVSRVKEWIELRGGGLVLLGENDFNGSIVAQNGRLGSILPAPLLSKSFSSETTETSSAEPVQSGVGKSTYRLSSPGSNGPNVLGAFFAELSASKSGTGGLSGSGFVFGALNPATQVLAEYRGTGPGEKSRPAILSMPLGYGCVVAFGPSDGWHIKTEEAEDQRQGPFETLWQGLGLWAVSGVRKHAEIILSNQIPVAGEQIGLSLKVQNENFKPIKIQKLTAQLTRIDDTEPESAARVVVMSPNISDNGEWNGSVSVAGSGRFALTVDYLAAGKNGTIVNQFGVSPPLSYEPGSAVDELGRSVREHGGRVYGPQDISSLVKVILSHDSTPRSVAKTWNLRTWWVLALILPFLFSIEWLVQRLFANGDALSRVDEKS